MLDLRPNCEYCDKDLPPAATDARICSYECTFCAGCVATHLHNVCPNCGGGFQPRPIRPSGKLVRNPASAQRVHLKKDKADVAAFVAALKSTAPEKR